VKYIILISENSTKEPSPYVFRMALILKSGRIKEKQGGPR